MQTLSKLLANLVLGSALVPALLVGSTARTLGPVAAAQAGAPQCHTRLVILHGTNQPTSTCLDPGKQSGIVPDTVTHDCNDGNLLQLFGDSEFGGAKICFWQTGFVNLGDYWIIGPLDNWNDTMSSYKTGKMSGKFYWDANGGGPQLTFNQGQNVTWIGSTWNDQVSSLSIDSCNGYC